MSLMEVFFKDPDNGTIIQVPKDIFIHIRSRSDMLQMLVKDKLHGVKNTQYKNSEMFDLILNDKDHENNLLKEQGLLLLKAQMIADMCWRTEETGELHPVKALWITGAHETQLVIGRLGDGWFMKSIDPGHILDCLGNYIDQGEDKDQEQQR